MRIKAQGTRKSGLLFVTRILARTIKCCYHFFSNQWMATTGEFFLMCFTSRVRMIINMVQGLSGLQVYKKSKAPKFWDTEKQVTTRGVGRNWWPQPGGIKKGLVISQVRTSGF